MFFSFFYYFSLLLLFSFQPAFFHPPATFFLFPSPQESYQDLFLQRNIEEFGEENVNKLNPQYSQGVSSPGRHVRTRLYFTSESHVHSLLTVLRHGPLCDIGTDEQWRRAMEYVSMVSELNYMSQIVIMLYEDPTKDPTSDERFHIELHFSPGVNCCVQKNLPPGPGFRPHSRNDSVTSKSNVRLVS